MQATDFPTNLLPSSFLSAIRTHHYWVNLALFSAENMRCDNEQENFELSAVTLRNLVLSSPASGLKRDFLTISKGIYHDAIQISL